MKPSSLKASPKLKAVCMKMQGKIITILNAII